MKMQLPVGPRADGWTTECQLSRRRVEGLITPGVHVRFCSVRTAIHHARGQFPVPDCYIRLLGSMRRRARSAPADVEGGDCQRRSIARVLAYDQYAPRGADAIE